MDSFCMEAFKALVTHEILTADEEKELLEAMPIEAQCDSPGSFLLVLFVCRMCLAFIRVPHKTEKQCNLSLTNGIALFRGLQHIFMIGLEPTIFLLWGKRDIYQDIPLSSW